MSCIYTVLDETFLIDNNLIINVLIKGNGVLNNRNFKNNFLKMLLTLFSEQTFLRALFL